MPIDRTDARRRLDGRFERIRPLVRESRPHRGWVRAIRDALGMSSAELGRRMAIGQQRVSNLERNEQQDSIRLGTLRRAADALDCDLVYFLVPRDRLDDMVKNQAVRKATKHIAVVSHHSRLEDQEVTDEDTAALIDELAMKFVNRSDLWSISMDPP